MRQGSRLSILARLALWAAVRARWWCVTIAGIVQIAFFRLIPPYSVRPQSSALRPRTTRFLVHGRVNRSTQVFSNEADHRATFGQQLGDPI
jgi:hypothetical protein